VQPPANLYTQGFGSRPESVEVPVIETRAPTPGDVNYPIGKRWIDRLTNVEYTLTSQSTAGGVLTSTWISGGSGSGNLNQLTPDIGGPVLPVSGNININGIGGLQTINAGNPTMQVNDLRWLTQFTVDPNASAGSDAEFTTITAAVAAASAAGGGTVFVRTGTYNESFTLPPKVILTAFPSAPSVFGSAIGAIINGTVTYAGPGESRINGISLTNSGASPALLLNGAGSGLLAINDCFFEGGTVAIIESSNANMTSIFFNCILIAETSDLINNTGGSFMFTDCLLPNIGGTVNIFINGMSAGAQFIGCSIGGPITLSNGAGVQLENSNAQLVTLNDTTGLKALYSSFNNNNGSVLILNDLSQANLNQCIVNAQTPAITVAVGANITIDQASISSSGAGFAITGTGGLFYGLLEFNNGANTLDPGLSISLFSVRPFSTAGASSAFADRGLASFNSSDFTVDTNGFVSLAGGISTIYDGDTGTAAPSGGVLDIIAGNASLNCGSSVQFQASGSQVELFVTDGASNTIIGSDSGTLVSPGTGNVVLGSASLNSSPTTNFNTISIGNNCLRAATAAMNHIAIGSEALSFITSGNNNIAIGILAGSSYTAAESANICIGADGTGGESQVTRIGTSQTTCYIAGIAGNSVSTPQYVTIDPATGQLGSSNTNVFNYKNVNFGLSPYTVLSTDYYISVDSSGGPITLNFPNVPSSDQVWIVKDRTGTSATNNITITTTGGSVTFDGATSYVIATHYQAINLLANATPTYEVF
jgi:hypothetical protein